MVRSKVKLNYIEDDSSRKATYRKRSRGLRKKVSELSTLCDIQACSIVYGPYDETPDVWPSQEGAREVLARFRRMPEYQQGIRKANQESFTNNRIKKQEEKLKKYQMQNYRNNMTRVMYMRMTGEATGKASEKDLIEMGSISEQKMKEIAARLEMLRAEASLGARERELAGQAHVFEGQINERLYNQQGNNWDGNSMLFPSTSNGNSAMPDNTNH